jgi:hypothetical protein
MGFKSDIQQEEYWQKWTKKLNLNITIETCDHLQDWAKLVNLKYHCLRIGENLVEAAFKETKGVSPLMVKLQIVDYLYLKNNEYWPKLIMREGLHSAILKKHPNLSTQEGGLIVGTGRDAKLAASVLIEMGFNHITFVDNDEENAQKLLADFQKNFFRIRFEVISTDKVILLPGIYSVIINSWEWESGKDSELLTDLLYFNYLKEPGIVINLKKTQGVDSLIEEAKAFNEKTIQRNEIDLFVEINALRPFVEIKEHHISELLANRP